MRRRARLCAATVGLIALVALAGCLPPSTAAPPATTTTTTTTTTLPPTPPPVGSVAIMGQSDLTAAQLVAFYTSHDPSTLPYRATGATLSDLATMFVSEGNRYNVRGDIAFAQSIVETAWFNFPDYGIVRTDNNNFAGIGACSTCGNGYQFSSALMGVRAQIQLLRNYADPTCRAATIPDAPVPELWGLDPATAIYNFDHFSAKGLAPTWNQMGNGMWAASPSYGATVLQVYNEIRVASGLAAV